ncbi:Protein ASPARTIC PROTEASE IN GUARD CELL 2 [Stylosanthes scabra]|uniref:Protein ASPARTIC PROTEASE IN GUARD CELL 2 n=1 Tax=Stylosanthes scabra TaxID=79078 RepID=A0ABU6QCR5_9FABA|nr:Protein ASPARTIC PROTEASE IN GUARD CELL 2 [Stylosanthes scabra]
MAIRIHIFLLFLLLLLPSASPITFHFEDFNVEETIAATKLRSIKEADTLQQSEEEPPPRLRKLKLHHRDKISALHDTLFTLQDHRSRFNSRMRRDAKRVASLVRRTAARSNSYKDDDNNEAFGFGSNVVSGTEEGSGEYFVRIGLGSPPTYQYMVVDSGSDIVWVQCQPCSQCYNQSDPLFNPATSASFSGVACSSAVCDRLENAGCHQGRCRYEVSYGDGSYTKGTLALETLTIGKTLVRNTAIGCGHLNQGMFVGAAGLLGLGGGPMSFIGQLGGQTGGAFGYCLVSRGSSGSSGSLEFGREAMPVGAAWVPLIHNPLFPSFYYVGLLGLGVGGSKLNISEEVFQINDLGEGGVVMDTGTAVTRLPSSAYEAFRDAFVAETTNLPRAPAVSIFDTCYDLNGFVMVRVPTVSFYFSSGPFLTLPARNFMIPADDVGTFCFAFAPSPSGLSIIGNIQQEGIQISIDGANGFVGFGPNVC